MFSEQAVRSISLAQMLCVRACGSADGPAAALGQGAGRDGKDMTPRNRPFVSLRARLLAPYCSHACTAYCPHLHPSPAHPLRSNCPVRACACTLISTGSPGGGADR